MERQPQGGERQNTHLQVVPGEHQTGEQSQHESWDERVIREGIEAALRESRNIDDRTARYIALQLHEGQASALYGLASSGTIDESRIHDELTKDFDQQDDQIKNWINWLGTYCLDRADKGPVDGWVERAAELDRQDQAQLRQEQEAEWLDFLFGETPDERLGSVDELGWFGLLRHQGRSGGIVLTQDQQGFRHVWETDSDEELHARWSAIEQEYARFYGEDDAQEHQASEGGGAQRDALGAAELSQAEASSGRASEAPDANAAGDVDASSQIQDDEPQPANEDTGLLEAVEAARQAGREIDSETARLVARRLCSELGRGPESALGILAGCGAILEDDVYEELYVDIDGQTAEQQELVDALYSYCIRREYKGPYSHWGRDADDRETASGVKPMVWVGSLSDYAAGVLHGMWIDAYQDPHELQAQVQWMLRTSPTAREEGVVAEEYGIFDYEGFGGMRLSEYEALETVSRLANGIAEHGEAFGAWAEYLGTDDMGQVEQTFEDAYQGTWESMQAYVENYLEESDTYSFMEFVPEWLRPYMKIDVEMLARDMELEMHVVEAAMVR